MIKIITNFLLLSLQIASLYSEESCTNIWSMDNNVNGRSLYKVTIKMCSEGDFPVMVTPSVPTLSFAPSPSIAPSSSFFNISDSLDNSSDTLIETISPSSSYLVSPSSYDATPSPSSYDATPSPSSYDTTPSPPSPPSTSYDFIPSPSSTPSTSYDTTPSPSSTPSTSYNIIPAPSLTPSTSYDIIPSPSPISNKLDISPIDNTYTPSANDANLNNFHPSPQEQYTDNTESTNLNDSNTLSPIYIVIITVSCNITVVTIFYIIYNILKQHHKCCFKNKIIDKTETTETLQERVERENRIARPVNPEQKTSFPQERPQFKRTVKNTIQKNKTIRMLSQQASTKQNNVPKSAGLLLLQEDIKQPPLPAGEPPPSAGEEKKQAPQNLSTITKKAQPLQRIRKKIQQKHRDMSTSNKQQQQQNLQQDKHIVDIKNT